MLERNGRVGRVRREPKVERPSDAAEEPQVRGILKREQVPCEARGANASNYKFEHSAFFSLLGAQASCRSAGGQL